MCKCFDSIGIMRRFNNAWVRLVQKVSSFQLNFKFLKIAWVVGMKLSTPVFRYPEFHLKLLDTTGPLVPKKQTSHEWLAGIYLQSVLTHHISQQQLQHQTDSNLFIMRLHQAALLLASASVLVGTNAFSAHFGRFTSKKIAFTQLEAVECRYW